MGKLTTIIVFIVSSLSFAAWADTCTADVESEGARLSGNRLYTTWHVRHNAGNERSATVSFEYKIHYLNKRGATLTDRLDRSIDDCYIRCEDED